MLSTALSGLFMGATLGLMMGMALHRSIPRALVCACVAGGLLASVMVLETRHRVQSSVCADCQTDDNLYAFRA